MYDRDNPRYTEHFKKYPRHLDYIELGVEASIEENHYLALLWSQEIVKEAPEFALGWFYVGTSHLVLGNNEESIFALEKAYELDPEDTTFYHNLGAAYVKLSKIEKGLEFFNKILVIDPNNLEVLNNKGDSLYKLGDIPGSIKCFQIVISKKSGDFPPYYGLVRSYLKNKDNKSAIKIAKDYLKINDKNPIMWHQLGKAHFQNKAHKQAIKAFLKAHQLNPRAIDSMESLVINYLEIEDINNAKEFALKIISRRPQDYNTLTLLGKIAEKEGVTNQAIEYYKKAVRINITHKPARMRLAALAPQQFTKDGMLVMSDRDVFEFTQMHVLTANGFKRQTIDSLPDRDIPSPAEIKKHKDKNIAEFKNQLKKNPKDAKALFGLASIYFSQKIFSEAEKAFTKAINQEPDNFEFNMLAGINCLQGGNPKSAVKFFENCLRINPRQSHMINHYLMRAKTEATGVPHGMDLNQTRVFPLQPVKPSKQHTKITDLDKKIKQLKDILAIRTVIGLSGLKAMTNIPISEIEEIVTVHLKLEIKNGKVIK